MKSGTLLLSLYLLLVATAYAANDSLLMAVVDAPPATLSAWNREIAVFRATVAGKTPAMRVESTIKRLKAVSDYKLYKEVEQRPIQVGEYRGVAFFIEADLLFALHEQDLDPETGETFEQLTERVMVRLDDLREAKRNQRRPDLLLRGGGLSLVATAAFALLLWILKRLQARVRSAIVRRTAKMKWTKIHKFDMRRFLFRAIRQLTKVIFIVIAFVAAYVWLGFVLSQFPFSAPWAAALGERLAGITTGMLEGLLRSIPNILIVVAIMLVTRWITTIVDGLFKSMEGDANHEGFLSGDTARATRRIVIVAIWIAGLVIAYPYIPGSDSAAFKGVSVLLGLMVSFGSSGVINQIMSGFVVLYSGAVRTGEFVRAGDIEGTVTDISLLSTRVLTPKNEYVTVPNAVLMGQNTINYSRLQAEDRTALSTSVSIGYDTPWRQVEAMLLLAADRSKGIRKQPPPWVLQAALKDFYIEYVLVFVPAEIKTKNATLTVLHQQILDVFNEFGVQIMSPNFEAQPPEQVVVPKQNWFLPPAKESGQAPQKKNTK